MQRDREYNRRYLMERRRKMSLWLYKHKLNKLCLDCGGIFHPVCMDFDHRDPATKRYSIGHMLNCTIEQIMQEIAKCDLVCSNCHRIRTWLKDEGRDLV